MTTIAYLAGLIDGEAAVSLHGRKSRTPNGFYCTPGIQITNTHRPLLDWLTANFGGGVYGFREERINRKPCWLWCIHGAKARELLRAVYPFLIVKREQTRVILELYAEQQKWPGR